MTDTTERACDMAKRLKEQSSTFRTMSAQSEREVAALLEELSDEVDLFAASAYRNQIRIDLAAAKDDFSTQWRSKQTAEIEALRKELAILKKEQTP